jgi:spermidine synthase
MSLMMPNEVPSMPSAQSAMNRMSLVDVAPIPGGGELRLFAEGEHFSIKIAGAGDLMSTRMHGSEDALARISCERIKAVNNPRMLIGGLGMGFTLAAALAVLGRDAKLIVAELVPRVVDWNRGPLGRHAGFPLNDARVEVRESDVAAVIRAERSSLDAILLDVDNGPGGLTQVGNDWLYASEGLAASMFALRPAGVLAIWSAHADAKFSQRLRQCGFVVDEIPVRAHGNKGARHLIWLASKPIGDLLRVPRKSISSKPRAPRRR